MNSEKWRKTVSRFSSLFAFRLRTVLLLATLFLGVGEALAGPLVLKDDYRSPRNKERPLRKATTLIVLHTTEAHAKSSLNKLSERGEAHYCVTDKGEVYRIIDRDREAFHAGRSMWNAKEDCDEFSIGIEVVGHHDQSMPLRQLEALKELLARLKKLYGIKDEQVVCHSHVAYGAPNTWHKKKHRGRKRCGMLFAMPSVRAKLGLKSRAAYDPDTRAKRLVQADDYLQTVLYGSVDTMVTYYGKAAAQVAVAPTTAPRPAVVAAKPKPAPAKPVAKPKPAPAAKSAVATKPPTKPAPKPTPKPVVKSAPPPRVAAKTPPPIEKPPLIVPQEEPEEKGHDWLRVVGLKGGYFKKDAKLIIPEPEVPAEDPPSVDVAEVPPPPNDEVLPLPANLHIGRAGDDVRDLAALAKLPGYTRGGPVSATLSPYRIAGAAWKSASTYYYSPEGKIMTGDKVDERSIEAGTFVFYKIK